MFTWISNNIGTIIICAVLIAIVTAIIVSMGADRDRHGDHRQHDQKEKAG